MFKRADAVLFVVHISPGFGMNLWQTYIMWICITYPCILANESIPCEG